MLIDVGALPEIVEDDAVVGFDVRTIIEELVDADGVVDMLIVGRVIEVLVDGNEMVEVFVGGGGVVDLSLNDDIVVEELGIFDTLVDAGNVVPGLEDGGKVDVLAEDSGIADEIVGDGAADVPVEDDIMVEIVSVVGIPVDIDRTVDVLAV